MTAAGMPPMAGGDPALDLRQQLDRLNADVLAAQTDAGVKWTAFEQARDAASAALATKGVDAPEVKAADDAHTAYEAAAATVKQRQDARELVARQVAKSGRGLRGGEAVDERSGGWLSAELKTLQAGTGLGAGLTPVQHIAAYFDRLAPVSVALASGVTVIDTDAGEVSVPRVTGDPAAGWTLPGGAINKSEPSGDAIQVIPQKLAGIVGIHSEVVADANPGAVAISERTLLRDMSLKLDRGVFKGTGVAPEPQGVTEYTGIADVPLAGPITDLDPFADAIEALELANAVATAIYAHPSAWSVVRKLREDGASLKPLISTGTEDAPRSIFGVPVYLSTQLDAAEIIVAEAPQIVLVRRSDAQIVVDPYYDLDHDIVGVRVISRWGVALPNPAAVAVISGITYP